MALSVATMFCCGFPISYGVWLILAVHLIVCVLYLWSAWVSIVLHSQSFSAQWDASTQMWATLLSISGLTVILAAMVGVYKRIEVNVRVYLYYLLICFVVDTVTVVKAFLFKDVCATSGNMLDLMADSLGKSFMCGFVRIAAYFAVAAVISVEVYCLYLVWSFCEDVHEGANGHGLWNMLPNKEEAFKRMRPPAREREYTHADIIGFAHQKTPGPYPSPYGALEGNHMVSHSLFGGKEHDMNYPPKPGF